MNDPARENKRSYSLNKLDKRLHRLAGKAIEDYTMIRDGERVLVCLSGGKDSYTLLEILLNLQSRAPIDFSIKAVNLDQKQPGFPADVLPDYLRGRGVDFEIIEQDTYSVVTDIVAAGKTMCGLCSRLRRGIIYRYAKDHGFTRIALGHHMDDIVETLFLNLFNGSKLKAMPPKLLSDDGRQVVIRPLAYCRERDIARFAEWHGFPIIPCNLCGSQPNLQRQAIKQMLQHWDRILPGRVDNVFRGLCNVVPSHLADTDLFDFAALETLVAPEPNAGNTEARGVLT